MFHSVSRVPFSPRSVQYSKSVLLVPGGRTSLPKFKFLAKLFIGVHVILQIQIEKNKKCIVSYVQNYFNRKSVGVQSFLK